MTKIKKWLISRYLPEYCRLSLLEENKQLTEKVEQLKRKNRELTAYINGLQNGIRAQRRIVIDTTQGRAE